MKIGRISMTLGMTRREAERFSRAFSEQLRSERLAGIRTQVLRTTRMEVPVSARRPGESPEHLAARTAGQLIDAIARQGQGHEGGGEG